MGFFEFNDAGRPLVVVPFRDNAGGRAVALLSGSSFEFVVDPSSGFVADVCREASHVVCFGHRELDDFCATGRVIYDVGLLYGGEEGLFELAQRHLDIGMARNIFERERAYTAHIRACNIAGVDLDRHSILRLVPPRVIQSLLKVRAIVVMALFERALRGESADLGEYERDTWPVARALRDVELAGIRVDRDRARAELSLSPPAHEARPLRQIEGSDGYVRTLFNPIGGKTGRFKVESGFNSLGIPHGPVRQCIVSRFEGGSVVTIDYNAIDYRSIVASVEDPDFRALYDGVDDFHAKTCEMVLQGKPDELRRDIIKYFSYVCIYGGSDETLQQKTRLSLEKVRQVKSVMERKLEPIIRFRRQLATQARRSGFVLLYDGRKVQVTPGDHDGKIIGLFAQGFSSSVFRKAVVRAVDYLRDKRSRLIFTVHDEVVIDQHPDEGKEMVVLQTLLERPVEGFSFRTKLRRGKTYGDATS